MTRKLRLRGIPVQLLGIFRLIMAVILSSTYFISAKLSQITLPDAERLQVILIVYLLFLLISTLLLKQLFFQTAALIYLLGIVDLAFIATLCYYTGGLASPLVILLLISFMIHGAFMTFWEAISFLCISVFIQLALWVQFNFNPDGLHDSLYNLLISQGILRLVGQNSFAFLALLLTNLWLYRYEESQYLIEDKNRQLQNAAALHEAVIQQSKSGLIVIDGESKIILMNDYIKTWFGNVDVQDENLMSYLPALTERFYLWNDLSFNDPSLFEYNEQKFYIEFNKISLTIGSYFIIQIEAAETINIRAQQEKLASLGRLTAAIAHEIRNPMAAIYQASQLLSEQEGRTAIEDKLTKMIDSNVQRANRIINDVLALARKSDTLRQYFRLKPFLQDIIDELVVEFPYLEAKIELFVESENMRFFCDKSILKQIVINLCKNAITHSGRASRELEIHLQAKFKGDSALLTVYDNGVGVAKEIQQYLFEPFYTTHNKGTGLGLYITKELCSASGGLIYYVENEDKHGFRLAFPKVHSGG